MRKKMMDEKKFESIKDLQSAIEILEIFAQKKVDSPSHSLLQKTISFAKELFSTPFSHEKQAIHHAVEIIKRNASFIQALAQGTDSQKQLASTVYHTIDRFNATWNHLKKRPLPWRRWMEQLHIEIPKSEKQGTSYKFHSFDQTKISYSIPSPTIVNDPLKYEIDAFRMKAITLLQHHEVKFTSLTEQLNLIREVPIITEETSLKALAESIIAMQQTISSFPGEMIQLKGSFKRTPQNHCRSIPIPESFHISTKFNQTGFPHPSQHNGWGLSSLLLPKDHLWKGKMCEIAENLRPNTALNLKAKKLLKLKQTCFDQHSQDFLNLHLQLNKAMLERIERYQNESIKNETLNSSSILKHFYENLNIRSSPHQYLSNLHQTIITQCFEKKAQILETKTYSQIDLNYIHLMIQIYETIQKHESSLLTQLSLKQLKEFIEELEMAQEFNSQTMTAWIRETLLEDVLKVRSDDLCD